MNRTWIKALASFSLALALLLCAAPLSFAEEGPAESDPALPDNGIPVVVIHIDESRGTIEDMNTSGDHSVYCYGTLDILVPEGFHYCDMPEVDLQSLQGMEMSIKGRGNSTWRQPKKPYKIKLGTATDVLGMGENKHWVLLANALDPSLLKDRFSAWLGERTGIGFTPQCLPVDVVMNGSYLGSYLLAEHVRVGENRVDIDELKKKDTDPAVITGGYLLHYGQQLALDSPDLFYTEHGAILGNHTPSFDPNDDGYENDIQKDYIRSYIQTMEDALFSEDMADEEGNSYTEYMDIESAAKYWLLEMVSCNRDAPGMGSTYFYKTRDTYDDAGNLVEKGKIYWGPFWDFDVAWPPDKRGDDRSDEERYREMGEFDLGNEWLRALLYDPAFVDQMVQVEWPSLRADLRALTADGGIIDQYYAEVAASQAVDFALWHPGQENDYAEEIADLKKRLDYRTDWVDQHIDELYTMVHRVIFKVEGEKDWVQYYPSGYSVLFYTPEREGYVFLGWLREDGTLATDDDQVFQDKTYVASFVSNSEATKATEILFRNSDVWADISDGYFRNNYTLFPQDAQDKSIVWSSSNEALAQVEGNGDVRLLGTGTVKITATLASGVSASYDLTITEGGPGLEALELVPTELELQVGEHAHIEAVVLPRLSQVFYFDYQSADPDIATVDSSGTVIARKEGTTQVTVTVSGDDEGKRGWVEKSQTCKVRVVKASGGGGDDPGDDTPGGGSGGKGSWSDLVGTGDDPMGMQLRLWFALMLLSFGFLALTLARRGRRGEN